jgi:hypothetical protein
MQKTVKIVPDIGITPERKFARKPAPSDARWP